MVNANGSLESGGEGEMRLPDLFSLLLATPVFIYTVLLVLPDHRMKSMYFLGGNGRVVLLAPACSQQENKYVLQSDFKGFLSINIL
jgi:hypothetical protein